MESKEIMREDELEFAIFCIESIAEKLKSTPKTVYEDLTEKSNILNQYIIPEYKILHTQSKEYIVEDILSVMREEGVLE